MKIKISSPNYIEEAGHSTSEGFAAYEEWLGCKVCKWCLDECDNDTAVFETRSSGKSVIKRLYLEVRDFVRTGKPIYVEITRGKKTVIYASVSVDAAKNLFQEMDTFFMLQQHEATYDDMLKSAKTESIRSHLLAKYAANEEELSATRLRIIACGFMHFDATSLSDIGL